RRDSLSGDLSAFVYAGMISAGPLILSIMGILLIGVLSLEVVKPPILIVQFQVSVTYLIAVSLVVTGAVQLLFTRFISDRMFEGRRDLVHASYNGMVLVTTVSTGLLAVCLAVLAFGGTSPLYRLLMVMGFVIISNVWVCIIFLASLKRYSVILAAFFLGYAVTVAVAAVLNTHGLEGLMAGFVIGHFVLLVCMTIVIRHEHVVTDRCYLSLAVFSRRHTYPTLILIGLLFNLGVWLD